jgi:hypothetical protein
MGTRVSLTTTVRRYINEPDSTNSNFTDAEIYDYVNQAIRYLGTEMEWPLQTAEATSVANQAVYALPEDFISLSDVYFDNQDIPVIDRTDLSTIRNDWQDAVAGTPSYAYKSDNAKIGLYPKPDTDGKILQIQYIKVPPDLSDDVTAPDLHVTFQDCLPFYAAFLCEYCMGNTKRADYNLALYESHKKKLMSKVQKFSDESLRFRW